MEWAWRFELQTSCAYGRLPAFRKKFAGSLQRNKSKRTQIRSMVRGRDFGTKSRYVMPSLGATFTLRATRQDEAITSFLEGATREIPQVPLGLGLSRESAQTASRSAP